MKIFVTGGTGFIGRYVVRDLAKKGHSLLLLSRTSHKNSRKISFVRGGLADIKKWEEKLKVFKPDVAVHLAWEGLPSSDFDITRNNLAGSIDLLRACRDAGVKTAMFCGTGLEYGQAARQMNETSPLDPSSLLASTKSALYIFGSKFAKDNGMNFIWVRPFFTYGPGQQPRALIPSLIRSLRAGETPEVKNPRGGNDFIYVEDAAQAIAILAGRKPKGPNEIYNIAAGKLTSNVEVIKDVYAGMGLKAPAAFLSAGAPQGAWADIKKVKKDTGWKPKTSLREGVKKTIEQSQ